MSGPEDKEETAKHRQNDEGRATWPTRLEAKINHDFGDSFTIKCVGVGESGHVTYMIPCMYYTRIKKSELLQLQSNDVKSPNFGQRFDNGATGNDKSTPDQDKPFLIS